MAVKDGKELAKILMLRDRELDAEDQPAQKQVDRVQPVGRPLERWGDKEVEITPEDVARAILEFNERVPEAAGLLDPKG